MPGSASLEGIYGGSGNDTILDGESGGGNGLSDSLHGVAGDGLYIVNSSDTDVYEAPGSGRNNTIVASTWYDLRPGQEIETLIGAGHVGGNELANTLIGRDGAADLIVGGPEPTTCPAGAAMIYW